MTIDPATAGFFVAYAIQLFPVVPSCSLDAKHRDMNGWV